MSRYPENRVRPVCLPGLLAAASLLAGCPDHDLPVGIVGAGAAGSGGTTSGGSGGNASGGSGGGTSGGQGGTASGGTGGNASGGTGGTTVGRDGGSNGGTGGSGSGSGGTGGSGSLDAGSTNSCSGDTRSPTADGCTPAVIEQNMSSCTRCGDIGYIWDGTTCKGIGGCACVKGCERVFRTREECNTAHVGCSAQACRNPRPRLIDGVPTGYVQCDDFTHRADKRDCPSKLPRMQMPNPPGPNVGCMTDADCTARPYGHCQAYSTFVGSGWSCRYGCVKDEDCGASEICECGDPIGTCRGSTCKTTGDCAPGMFCASGSGETCEPRFACHSAADQCRTSADCPQPRSLNYCAITATGRACRSRPQDVSCP